MWTVRTQPWEWVVHPQRLWPSLSCRRSKASWLLKVWRTEGWGGRRDGPFKEIFLFNEKCTYHKCVPWSVSPNWTYSFTSTKHQTFPVPQKSTSYLLSVTCPLKDNHCLHFYQHSLVLPIRNVLCFFHSAWCLWDSPIVLCWHWVIHNLFLHSAFGIWVVSYLGLL